MLPKMARLAFVVFALRAQDTATIQRYCGTCHSAALHTAGLILENSTPAQHPARWEKVVRRLRARQMPPVGAPRPTETAYRSLIASLESTLDQLAAARPDPGRTDTFRRLNRTEYRNSIRDLLALDVNVNDLLPTDEAAHGFDNITVADLSPTLLEKYLAAARRISRLALGIPPRRPGGDTTILRPDLTQEEHFDGLPLGTRGGALLTHTFPADAEYEFTIRLARDRNEHVEGLGNRPHNVELLIDGERAKLFTARPPDKGEDHSVVDRDMTIRLPIKAGPRSIIVTFPKLPSTLLETERQPYPAHFNMDRHPRITPALYSLSINGPYSAQGPGDTPSRQRILSCRPRAATEEEPCAQQIFRTLARRAFRRPVTDSDLRAPLRFYRESRATEGFDGAIEMGLRSLLVSPEFLFRVERDPAKANGPYRISELELASRVSFFLWSSIPDDALLDAAIAGRLRATLPQHVERLLADARSQSLVNNFAAQWLHLRNLDTVTPDMRAFVDFDDNLRQAMRRETELFFEHVVRQNRPVTELLRANYTFLNERLARHYQIPKIYGSRFRMVPLAADSRQRGGLLRQASILTVTSYANRTSPVIRGKWILDNILGIPPPPPPGAVPALKENPATGAKPLTVRERLAQHRENPSCRGCHQLMDPIGFALENYDAVGRWRNTEESRPLDVEGALPDGAPFRGVEGLEQALLARPELFATTVAEKLLTYALGRGVESQDAAAVRRIVRQAEASQFRFSSFILGIVESAPFQMRRPAS